MANFSITGKGKINGKDISAVSEEDVSYTNWSGRVIKNHTTNTKIIIGQTTNEDGTITFPEPFSNTPIVICGIINTSATNQISYRTMSAVSITNSGFEYQVTGSACKTFIAVGSF